MLTPKEKRCKAALFFFCKHENYLPVLKFTKPGVITFPEGGKKSVFLYFFFEFHGQVGEIRKINESRHSSCVDVKFTYLCSPLPYFFCFTDAISPLWDLPGVSWKPLSPMTLSWFYLTFWPQLVGFFCITLSWLPVAFNLVAHLKLGSLTQKVILLQFWRQIVWCQCHWADVKVWTG